METKTKIFTGVASVTLFLVFIGYYFALFNGNQNNTSTYTNLILVCSCLTGVFWAKEKTKNKFGDILLKVDMVLFAIWAITIAAQLFI